MEERSLRASKLIQKASLGLGIILVVAWGAFGLSYTFLGIGMTLIALPVFFRASDIEAEHEAENGPEFIDSDGGIRADKESLSPVSEPTGRMDVDNIVHRSFDPHVIRNVQPGDESPTGEGNPSYGKKAPFLPDQD